MIVKLMHRRTSIQSCPILACLSGTQEGHRSWMNCGATWPVGRWGWLLPLCAAALRYEGAITFREICVLQLAVVLAVTYCDKNGRISDARKINKLEPASQPALFFSPFPVGLNLSCPIGLPKHLLYFSPWLQLRFRTGRKFFRMLQKYWW